MSANYKELKRQAFEANMALPKLGLVAFTFGNVSAIDRKRGVFAIKPSGVPYDDLKVEDLVVVDMKGKAVEGKLAPSSDTPTHWVLYRDFPEIGGIVHTHSACAVAWAQAQRPIPILGTTHADHLPVDVPCTDLMTDKMIQGDYEIETGNQITGHFKRRGLKPVEVPMVLIAGHGPFAWGKDASKAVYNAKMLEELASMALMTLQLNPKIGRLKQALIDKHYQRKHGKNAYYGQAKGH
jgi:L-ribulose-5-phosphate 4-epimerase